MVQEPIRGYCEGRSELDALQHLGDHAQGEGRVL